MAYLGYNNTKVNKLYYQNTEVKKCYYQNVLVHNSFPSTTPGDIGVWDDKEWLVCHYNSSKNQVYLIAKDIISYTTFGSNTTYAGSILAQVAINYQNNNMSSAALAKCVNVTVNGITAKVFIPSFDQMNGGFSWFNGNTNRIAYYNGLADIYWTSSASSSSYAWYVAPDGGLNFFDPNNLYGFRPCVCVQL